MSESIRAIADSRELELELNRLNPSAANTPAAATCNFVAAGSRNSTA